MEIKVYSPNGKELSIHVKKLNECPLSHKLALIENMYENGEGVDLLRNFIKLRGI